MFETNALACSMFISLGMLSTGSHVITKVNGFHQDSTLTALVNQKVTGCEPKSAYYSMLFSNGLKHKLERQSIVRHAKQTSIQDFLVS